MSLLRLLKNSSVLVITFVGLSGCSVLESFAPKDDLDLQGKVLISSAKLRGTDLLLEGDGLSNVTSATLRSGESTIDLSILEKESSHLAASLGRNLSVALGTKYDLLLTTAHASEIITLTVDLNGTKASNFESTGIDDNAGATSLTIDPDNNVQLEGGKLRFNLPGVEHGITSLVPTTVFGQIGAWRKAGGGLEIMGVNDSNATDNPGVALGGAISKEEEGIPAIRLNAFVKKETGLGQLTSAGRVLSIFNYKTEVLTMLGDGKTGLGTHEPKHLFHVVGAKGEGSISVEDSGSHAGIVLRTDGESAGRSLIEYTDGEKVIWSSGSNVTSGARGAYQIVNGTASSIPFAIEDGASSHSLHIALDGKIGINVDSPQKALDVAGEIRASGAIVSSATFVSSDLRLKRDILPIERALDKVLALNAITYEWKDPARGEGRQLGFIAQNVERVFPEAVVTDRDGMKAVNYSSLVAPTIAAVRELEAENRELKSRLIKLEERLEKIESRRF